MHRIRPQSYKIIAKKKTLSYRLTQKNEKYIQSHENKREFLSLFQRLKNINYYTLHNSRISYSFSALYKIYLYYLCYERLHYLHDRQHERKKCVFFAKILADMTLRAQKNALDGIFQTLRRAKQRCERRNRKEEIKIISKHFNGLG